MNIAPLNTALKQHPPTKPDGSQGLSLRKGVVGGLTSLPIDQGRHSQGQNASSPSASVLPAIPNALQARDGRWMRYDWAKSKDRRPHQKKTEAFLKGLRNPNKEQLPRIDLRNGCLSGFFADFDSLEKLSGLLPVGLELSWVNARRWLALKHQNACVFPSASGKAKAFFPTQGRPLDQAKAKDYLAVLLSPEYAQATDDKGLRYSFINAAGYSELASWLQSSAYITALEHNSSLLVNHHRVIQLKRERESKDIAFTIKPPVYEWNSFKGPVSDLMLEDVKGKAKSPHIEGVIRYALGSRTCIGSGVAIPQDLLGKALGISQPTASRALADAVRLGVLRVVTPYIARARAATYAFCGFWAVEAARIFRTRPEAHTGRVKGILDSITDGTWNDGLFRLTNYFGTESDYMAYVESIPGYRLKSERARQAVNAWRCHVVNDEKKRLSALKTA